MVGTLRFAHPMDLSPKSRHQFHMRRMAELVDWRDALDFITTVDQYFRVAGKCRHVARYRDDHRNLAGRKLRDLRLSTLSRRIEHDRIVIAQFLRHQRTTEQIARLGLQRL